MSIKGREDLRQICKTQNKLIFNIFILSSRLEIGLWNRAIYSPLDLLRQMDHVDKQQEFDETLKRFDLEIPNFEQAINLQVLKSIYSTLDGLPWVKRALDEICITYLSILIVFCRYEAFTVAYEKIK